MAKFGMQQACEVYDPRSYEATAARAYIEPAREQTKVQVLANKFDLAISRLGAVIDSGSEKLAPLLRDPYPKPEPGANKMEFESALLAGMSAKIDRMNELADRLADLFDRVEL